MSSLPRIRRPRKATTPDVRIAPLSAPAESWPAWTDNWYWNVGSCPDDLAAHVTIPLPEPDAPDGESGWAALMVASSAPPIPGIHPEPETDEQWLARVVAEEQAEKDRIETTYFPTRQDLAEYDAYLASLDEGGKLPPIEPAFRTIEEWDALRRNQVSSDELAQLAAHGCI